MIIPFNPLKLISNKLSVNVDLYVRTLEILEQWSPLIIKYRGISKLPLIKEKTLDIVLRNYRSEIGLLEAYVKETALTVGVNAKSSSIDIQIGEDNSSTIKDIVSDEHKLVEAPDKRMVTHLIEEGYLWSDWLDSLRDVTIPKDYLTYENVIRLLSLVPTLEKVFYYQSQEMVKGESGGMTKEDYKNYYTGLVNSICKSSGLKRKEVMSDLHIWVSLFLRNLDVLRKQFALMMSSTITMFNNKKSTSKQPYVGIEFGLDADYLVTKTKKSRLYSLDLSYILDKVFDNYYSETYSTLSFTLEGVTFYNVLGGVLMTKGDLSTAIIENVCEIVLTTLNCRYVAMTDEFLYFESYKDDLDVSFFVYYFGVSLPFSLVKLPNRTEIKGGLIHDFTEYLP